MNAKDADKNPLKIILRSAEEAPAEQSYQVIQIAPQVSPFRKPKTAPPVYVTHCLVDLGKWRRKAKRWTEKQAEWPECEPARAGLLQELSSLVLMMASQSLPEVVVMDWTDEGLIQTNSAVVDGIIFLNRKLSTDWANGKESDAALRTLINALEGLTYPQVFPTNLSMD